MIETALSSSPINLTISELQHYVHDDAFKLFKLHGSVNRAREDRRRFRQRVYGRGVHQLINMAPELNIRDRFSLVQNNPWPDTVGSVPIYSAIAIPVEGKSDFECPSDHLDCLCKHLGKVTRIVYYSVWRPMNTHFLKLLKEHLQKKFPFMQWRVKSRKPKVSCNALKLRDTRQG